jgi:hypothetical protein
MSKRLYFGIALLLSAAVANPAAAEVLAPVSAGPLDPGSSFVDAINGTPKSQFDPHISGDLVSYTDFFSGAGQIRYYDFQWMVDAAIVPGEIGDIDVESSVSGTRIAFARWRGSNTAIIVFDTATQTSTEIDPQPGSQRYSPSIGGARVAFLDNKIELSFGFAVVVHDLVTHATTNLSAGLTYENSIGRVPSVAPDGNTVVFSSCDHILANCDV